MGPDPAIDEASLNAYLAVRATREPKIESLSMDLTAGRARVRCVWTFGEMKISTLKIPLKLSCDLVCVPRGGGVKTVGGAVGHLPLPGVLATPVRIPFAALARRQKDWQSLNAVSAIRMADDWLWLTVTK